MKLILQFAIFPDNYISMFFGREMRDDVENEESSSLEYGFDDGASGDDGGDYIVVDHDIKSTIVLMGLKTVRSII